MYKVVCIERLHNTVHCENRQFTDRAKAELFFTEEQRKREVVRAILYYCTPSGEEKELACFSRQR